MLVFWKRFLEKWPALVAALLVSAGFLTGVPAGQDLNAPKRPQQTQVMKVYGTSNSSILQGGCTDGTLIYLIFTDGASSGAKDRLRASSSLRTTRRTQGCSRSSIRQR